MLAQNFKTAAELRISDAEQGALVQVLGMMEREEITKEHFAMESWDCGTTACICGWARRVGGADLFDQNWVGNPPLQALFGGNDQAVIDCRNPQQAATALRSYLTLGQPNWSDALAAV